MKRILIVTVNWLGDAVMTTPAARALKTAIPDAYVAVMGASRVRDVFTGNPYVDEFIEFDEHVTHRGFIAKLSCIAFLRKREFDTVFLIHRSFTRALICFLAAIPYRVGWKRLKTTGIVNRPIVAPAGTPHRQDYYLHLFERAGIPVRDKNPEVFLSIEERAAADKFLTTLPAAQSRIVGIHAGANWIRKRWPPESFAELSDRLAQELKCTIVFTGSAEDLSLIESITAKMRAAATILCGKTSLRELAAIMTRMSIFISNDSGPAHLAASLAVPTLVIFGPTSPAITAVRGALVTILSGENECVIPCYRNDCLDNRCMRRVSVQDVYSKILEILAQR